jgi:F420-non-reducing hydrogenase iron-sulfur subunit
VEYAQHLLEEIGLGRGRLQMFEIAASDAPKWVAAVKEMTERVRELGPNPLKRGRSHPGDVLKFDESMVEA